MRRKMTVHIQSMSRYNRWSHTRTTSPPATTTSAYLYFNKLYHSQVRINYNNSCTGLTKDICNSYFIYARGHTLLFPCLFVYIPLILSFLIYTGIIFLFSGSIRPICIPKGNLVNQQFEGYTPFVAGWGLTSFRMFVFILTPNSIVSCNPLLYLRT